MLPYLKDVWGNPSSPHAKGREAREALEQARATVAELTGYKPHEVVFTASGSEGNTLAIRGICERWERNHNKPGRILTSAIEHKCTLEAVKRMRDLGWDVVLLPVDEFGAMHPESLQEALQEEATLVTIQWANNEVGTLQPIKEVAALCTEAGVPFHCDAVQAIAHLELPSPIPDLMTIAAHKFSGPKGVGALCVKEEVELDAQVRGGDQEMHLRAGTENVPGAVGLAEALKLAKENQAEETKRLTELRDFFTAKALKLPHVSLNGHQTNRLPNLTNLRFNGRRGETLVMQLDQAGICASTGSACTTGASEPSHVLCAMDQSKEATESVVRFSFGSTTTQKDVEQTLHVLQQIVQS